MNVLVFSIIPVTLLCAFVAWKDLSKMEIPNEAVLVAVAIYAIGGAVLLPLGPYMQGWVQGIWVLLFGFALFHMGIMGGGDAKFAAAMALFIGAGDGFAFTLMLLVVMVLCFAVHRLLKHLPRVRSATPDWVSWHSKAFPMGLPMGLALVIYSFVSPMGGVPNGL